MMDPKIMNERMKVADNQLSSLGFILLGFVGFLLQIASTCGRQLPTRMELLSSLNLIRI